MVTFSLIFTIPLRHYNLAQLSPPSLWFVRVRMNLWGTLGCFNHLFSLMNRGFKVTQQAA